MKSFLIAVSATLLAGSTLVGGSSYARVLHPRAHSKAGAAVRQPVADRVPDLDIKKACRQASIGPAACITDEEAAHQMLVQQWPSFPARDKSSCVTELRTVDRSTSYVDLLSCLQIDADMRKPLQPPSETAVPAAPKRTRPAPAPR